MSALTGIQDMVFESLSLKRLNMPTLAQMMV